MKRFIIGIDPGTKTGVAVWLPDERRFLGIKTTTISNAMEIVKTYADRGEVFVRFEDARQRKWYGPNADAKRMGAGSVKRDCTIWEGFLKTVDNVTYEAVDPKNCTTKMNAKYFEQLTGYKGRTSYHGRDAALLVYERIWPYYQIRYCK